MMIVGLASVMAKYRNQVVRGARARDIKLSATLERRGVNNRRALICYPFDDDEVAMLKSIIEPADMQFIIFDPTNTIPANWRAPLEDEMLTQAERDAFILEITSGS